MTKKFFFLSFFLLFLTTSLHAEILTIDQEPPELKKLQATFEQQMKNASTPAKLNQLRKELEASKAKALQSPTFIKKVSSLEKARDLEVKKIQALYNDRIGALKKEALNSVDQKYQVVFNNFKNKSVKNVKKQYIVELKRLEDKLIRQNNLAGALVVQTNRNKAMGLTGSNTATPAPAPKKAPAPVTKTAVKKSAAKTAPPAPKKVAAPAARKLSAAQPQTYTSKAKGIAGSGSNNTNNTYAFDVQLFGNESWLSFNGYGRKTNNSFGEVYLITPSGQRHQVASWSPKQLKPTNYYGVESAKDVQPIKANISEFVKATGTYKVEFTYRDGNEALHIFQVDIKTW